MIDNCGVNMLDTVLFTFGGIVINWRSVISLSYLFKSYNNFPVRCKQLIIYDR